MFAIAASAYVWIDGKLLLIRSVRGAFGIGLMMFIMSKIAHGWYATVFLCSCNVLGVKDNQ